MLVGISILVACATFFAYCQLPGSAAHDQAEASGPSPSSAASAAASTQQSSSFPSLIWAFLCAALGLSSGGRSRGGGGSGSGSSRVLSARAASTVSSASIQLPLLRQGSSFPISTSSTSFSAASVPAISNVPQMTVSSPDESPDATPKARPSQVANGIAHVPYISLSTEDEEDDDTPPVFPAINSAQRARSSTPASTPRLNGNISPAGFSMPPPPLPQIRGRNPRSQPTTLPTPSAPRPSPAALARGPIPQRSPFLPGTAGGTAQAANGGISSIGAGALAVPPSHNAPPTKPTRKVILEPGHSPLDWARLCRTASPEVLRGPGVPPGLLRVTPSMLAKHGRPRKPRNKDKGGKVSENGESKQEMVWMALEGKVYNITAYMPFHPGGEGELLRAAGKDGTSLFMKTHSWVNVEGMLGGCLIGILVSEEEGLEGGVKVGPRLEDVD